MDDISRTTGSAATDVREVRARVAGHLVGRDRELDLLLAAVAAGRDVLLEGPPGTSKSTLLRAVTTEWGIPLLFVEGNADLTPTRLVGHHNPARVLREDYTAENFVPGPLVEAMRQGGFLYVEEFNRAPEDTLNTLLTAMAERRITVPTVGTVEAAPTFRVVASMNPYDSVGTTRMPTSVSDRMCRLAVGYQDAEAERGIVGRRTGVESPRLVADAVALTRATRERDDIRQGSSVRGAIDVALVAAQLAAIRGIPLPTPTASALPIGDGPTESARPVDPPTRSALSAGNVPTTSALSAGNATEGALSVDGPTTSALLVGDAAMEGAPSVGDPTERALVVGGAPRDLPADYTEVVWDAMLVALSGRVHLDEIAEQTPEGVLREIWEDHFLLRPAEAAPG